MYDVSCLYGLQGKCKIWELAHLPLACLLESTGGLFSYEVKMRDIVRKRILEKCKHRCMNCGSTEKLEVDHIIPLTRGGRHDEDNMQILCKSCNCKKHNSIDFRKYFKIGESLDYIYVRRGFPLRAFSHLEIYAIFNQMFRMNDEVIYEDKPRDFILAGDEENYVRFFKEHFIMFGG